MYILQKDYDFTVYPALIIVDYTNYDILHEKCIEENYLCEATQAGIEVM